MLGRCRLLQRNVGLLVVILSCMLNDSDIERHYICKIHYVIMITICYQFVMARANHNSTSSTEQWP